MHWLGTRGMLQRVDRHDTQWSHALRKRSHKARGEDLATEARGSPCWPIGVNHISLQRALTSGVGLLAAKTVPSASLALRSIELDR